MTLQRRRFLHLVAGAAALPALPRLASALDYPTRPVRIVVPYPAGIAPDIVARVVAQALSQRLKQQFVVDNRPGGASNVGTAIVAHAPPDGYTLLVVTTTNAINTSLYDSLDFDLMRDIAPVAGLVRLGLVIVVHPSVPAQTLAEFIAYAKANPGKINYASVGSGAATNVAGELFKAMAGVKLVNVPYRGNYLPGIHQSGQAAGAGGNRRDALGLAAGCPRRGGIRARLPSLCLGCGRRAREHAGGNYRSAQQRDQRRSLGSDDKGAVCELGRRADADDARRVRDIHHERNREVGPDRQNRAHQGGLKPILTVPTSGMVGIPCGRSARSCRDPFQVLARVM